LLSALALGALAALAHAQTTQIVTAHLPPFALEGAPSAPGALHEVVAEMARRANMPVTISFVPWPRAVLLTNSMTRTGIFPLTRTPEREKQFRWLVPVLAEHYVFFADGNSHFDLDHPENMKHKRIGALRGSAMASELRDMGYHNVIESGSVAEGRRFLARGIVDAMIGNREIVRRSLKGTPEEDRFKMSKPVRTAQAWLAGSLDFTEKDAALLDKAMLSMVEDGTYASILKKYALNPD
jgi:polar amino acid transport system substrate-binding protein